MSIPNSYIASPTSPAGTSAAVSPSDSVPLTAMARGIFVGTGGNIALRLVNDSGPQTYLNVPSGTLLPFAATYVYATGTTASNIIAVW